MSVDVRKQTTLPAHKWQVSCVEFSPDGLFLASGSWDKTAIIWDLRTLETSQIISQHRQPVTCVAFEPKFSRTGLLATGSADHTVALWNHLTGALVKSFQNHANWVLSTAFSPNGRLLAAASWDKLISICDVATGKLLSTLTGHTTGVWACSFNPEEGSGDMLCSGAEDGGLKLWDMRSNSVVMSLVGSHEDRIKSCSWSSKGKYVASSSADGKLTLWEPRSGTALTKIKAYDDSANGVKFYPAIKDNTVPLLFSVGAHTCNIWHPFRKQSKQLFSYKVNETGEEIQALDISPDGTLLATCGSDTDVILSSITISLDEIDALPIDTGEKKMSHGTLLWKKYTRKVIEKTNNKELPVRSRVTDQAHNSALLVGLAVHKNEEVVKKYVQKAGTPNHNSEKLHAESEVLLQHQRQKLRHRKGSGNLFEEQTKDGEQKRLSYSPAVQSHINEVRQHLRKVSKTSGGAEISNQESSSSKVNGWNNVPNGNHRNGYSAKDSSISPGSNRGVIVPIGNENENMSNGRQGNGRLPHYQTNGYHANHTYEAVRGPRVNIQQSGTYQPFNISNEREKLSNGSDDLESVSASSSSYYADIDEVAQEMLELTRQVDHRF